MTRLGDIKDQLLEARKETLAELNQIDKALDAIGIQRQQQEEPRQRQRRDRSTRVRPTTKENVDRIMRVMDTATRPLTTRQVAEAAGVNRDLTGKTLSWLEHQEKKVRKEGFVKAAGGKGRAHLYVATGRDLSQALRPSAVSRIEEQAHPVPVGGNQG